MNKVYIKINTVNFGGHKKRHNGHNKQLKQLYKDYLKREAQAVIDLEHEKVTECEFYRQRWLELDEIVREYLGMES